MRKFLITMMCIIMVVCFMPTVAMAETQSPCSMGDGCTHVAAIGTTHYDNLETAFGAAISGDTVILLKDYEDPTGESYVVYNMSGVTFDLNGKTYTTANFAHVFQGTGGIITNGKMVCSGGGSYALFIGDEGETTSFTVRNVECTGGINVYNATGVVLEGSSTKIFGTKYYALWLDEAAEVTVKSGIYSAGDKQLLSATKMQSDPTIKSVINVLGGTFITSTKDLFLDNGGVLNIVGGTFSNVDALNYLDENANVTVKLDGPVNESITIPSGKTVTLDLNGQRITSTDESAVIVSKDSNLVVEDTSNDKTGSITGATVGIKMGNAPENGQDANSSLTINGGTISGGAFGISGNGNRHGTTIIVNNGNITGDATGIYHPQDGELTVKGGTITGGTGIEIRSGQLTVENGTIRGTSTPAESTPNGNGTTTDGAGIAVAQHTTKKPINVIVKGGTIEGYSALYQSNPQNNPAEDVANVSLQVLGGNFNAINNGTVAVYSENKTGFITGGTFDTDPTEYVASGYTVTGKGPFTVKLVYTYIPTIQKPTVEADANAKTTLSSDGTKLTIEAAEGYEIADVTLNGVSKGAVKELTGLKTGDKVVVMTKAAANEPTLEEIKTQMAAINSDNFYARSKLIKMKSGKKAVKVTWYTTEDVEFDGVEIFRSTKRYSGYGTKPFYTTTKDVYYNTAIKDGAKYYYKVRGYVLVNGEKVYTDYSTKAWRTVK